MPAHFENGRKFDGKRWLQDFDAKETYLHPKNRPVSIQKRRKMFCLHHCRVSHDAVSNLCRLGFRCQIYCFRNLPAKNVPFLCEQEAYPSHFSPFGKFAGVV